WYKDRSGRGNWQEAPPLSEEIYNLEDALVVAQWMNVFLRRCDVLHIACLAQIINTIAPLTTRGEQLLRQTTFYPFMLWSNHAAGVSLAALTLAPQHETRAFGPVPLLDVAASYDAANDCGAVFLVNRSEHEAVTTEIIWSGGAPTQVPAIYQMSGSDPKAANTFEQPRGVVPQQLGALPVRDGQLSLRLPPLSFTVVTTATYVDKQ
ncbi:MAG: alpha-N-arabinofuranosidase, partial [Roseiflexaceae bacterium]|nr:alpha-N-arabinofuranosidase [Roseiflexaceae bacterium]